MYNTDMYNTESLGALVGALAGFLIIFLIVFIAILVFYLIGLWKMFKKAGKGGWEAIVPYYNTWVLVEIVGLQWWWFLIALVPTIINLLGLESLIFIGNIANLIANINIYYNLSKRFNKTTGWVVLSVFFGFITIPLLGYSKNEVWDTTAPVTPNGLFDGNKGSASTTASAAPAPEAQQQNVAPMANVQPNVAPMANVQQPVNPEYVNNDINNNNGMNNNQ